MRGNTSRRGFKLPGKFPASFLLTVTKGRRFNHSMPKHFQISRRSFLRSCTATAAATGLPLWFIQRELARAAEQPGASVPSPNDRPGIALVGCGGMGAGDLQAASRFGNVVALCDVKENQTSALAARYAQNG